MVQSPSWSSVTLMMPSEKAREMLPPGLREESRRLAMASGVAGACMSLIVFSVMIAAPSSKLP